MKKLCFIALTLATLFALPACNDNRKAKNYNARTHVDDDGIKFLTAANESGNAEVALSKIALKNSTNQQVVAFANMMINDHTAAGNELNKIAQDQMVTVLPDLLPDHKNLLDSLSTKKGTDFDKLYMQTMVNDHEKAVTIFREAESNSDGKIKDFAKKTLPKLEGHLKEANSLCTGLK